MIELLILILVGVVVGARYQAQINPMIDKALAWLKAKLA